MANVEFKIYSNKYPVNLNVRFYHNKIDCSTKSNIFIDKNDVRFKKIGLGKKSKTSVQILNEDIINKTQKLSKDILDKFKEDFPKGNTINIKWFQKIVDNFHGKADDEDDSRYFFVPFVNSYIKRAATEINPQTGKRLDSKTITRYKYTLSKIKEYEEYSGEKIRIEDVDLEFHNSFLQYLLEVCVPYGDETIKKFISQIRQFIRDAKIKGYKTSPEIDSRKFTYKAGETIDTYLDEEEIDLIYKLDLSSNLKLDNVRDLFIVGLRTGLRISDLKRINKFEISNNLIKITQLEKTDRFIEIPMHPQLKEIFEKRQGVFPEISEQRFNEYVKDLCEEAKITEVILGSIKNSETNRKVRGLYPKYKLIASHTCRRSFVTNLYGKAEIPDLTIMAITGHKKHSQFLDYVKTTNKEHIEKLAQHWKTELEKSKELEKKEDL